MLQQGKFKAGGQQSAAAISKGDVLGKKQNIPQQN